MSVPLPSAQEAQRRQIRKIKRDEDEHDQEDREEVSRNLCGTSSQLTVRTCACCFHPSNVACVLRCRALAHAARRSLRAACRDLQHFSGSAGECLSGYPMRNTTLAPSTLAKAVRFQWCVQVVRTAPPWSKIHGRSTFRAVEGVPTSGVFQHVT